jgi:molybdopterin-guanine dinucleotide biosynthesis protein A
LRQPNVTTGVVLAGGASSRFGGQPKGLQLFRGQAMALVVADVLRGVCERVVIEAPRGAGYEALGLPVIHAAAEHAGKGPLAGMVAGLASAASGDLVAFAPCDMPLISDRLYRALMRDGGSAYAVSPRGAEALVAVLRSDALFLLSATLLLDRLPRTVAALEAAGARGVEFDDATPFANVNTPEDLARLARLE